MKRKAYSFFFAFYFLSTGTMVLTQAQVDTSRTLGNVVVRGEFEVVAGEEKLPVHLAPDFTTVLKIPEQIDWKLLNNQIPDLDKDWNAFDFHLSAPELASIPPAPAKVFHVQFHGLARWQLEIFASDGSLFRTISGEGNPLAEIIWDGLGDNGRPFVPGGEYSYSFTAIDQAGNKRIFPGESFTILSGFLSFGDSTWVGIAAEHIFTPDGLGISSSAGSWIKELASLIRFYTRKGVIKIACQHPQKDKFLQLLAKNLGKNIDFFLQVPGGEDEKSGIAIWIQ